MGEVSMPKKHTLYSVIGILFVLMTTVQRPTTIFASRAKIPVSTLRLNVRADNTDSKIVLISDGDFAVSGSQQGSQLPQDNVSLMVNSVDWLSDDTGLIDLRTKEVTSRPIKEMPDGTKAFLKWFNFLLPIILIIIYELIRMQINRNKRIKRLEVSYE